MCWVQVREGITMHGYVSTLKVVSRVVCDERLEAMILHGTKYMIDETNSLNSFSFPPCICIHYFLYLIRNLARDKATGSVGVDAISSGLT